MLSLCYLKMSYISAIISLIEGCLFFSFFIAIITDRKLDNITYFLFLFPEMKFSGKSTMQISALKIEVSFGRCFFFILFLHNAALLYFDSFVNMNGCLEWLSLIFSNFSKKLRGCVFYDACCGLGLFLVFLWSKKI